VRPIKDNRHGSTTKKAPPRNADFQSAVSQVFNLPGVQKVGGANSLDRLAECNSAIQQIANLRYADRTPVE
jgi:hypothetical protein